MLKSDFLKNLLAACSGLAVSAVFLVNAIFIPTFDMEFYRHEYAKYGISEAIGVSEDELMSVTHRLTDYMAGRAEDLTIEVNVNGEPREFFSDREKAHMVDVKDLFTIADRAYKAAICVILLTLVLLRKTLLRMLRVHLWVQLGLLIFLGGLAAIISLDFTGAFTVFHLIFFNNDLWILDPATDLLINIVPQEFFVDIAIRVGLIFGGLTFGYILVLAACLYFIRRRL